MGVTGAVGSRGGRRIVGAAVLLVLLIAASASAALAQETQLGGKLRAGERVLVPAGDVVEGDLYASGGTVRIEGTVTGDLLASGGQVDVVGEVGGDVMAAGGQIDITGQVDGDVRAAGGQLNILGSVGEDLFVAGGLVTLSGEVGEDLVFGTGQMVLNGSVAGDVLGSAGNYVRNGTIGGTENVTIVETEARAPTVADRIIDALQRFVGLLVVAGLALWLVPGAIVGPTRTLRQRPLTSLGLGVLALAGLLVAVALLILVTTLLAIVLGFLGLSDLVGALVFLLVVTLIVLAFLVFLAVTFGAPATVGMALGDLVFGTTSRARQWTALIVGLAVIVAVTSLPIVGGWIAFFVVLFGLGAILLAPTSQRSVPEDTEPVDTTA